MVVYTADIGSWPQLWRVSIDGGEPVKISDERAAWPAVSPDGKLIACMARELGDANANEHFVGLMAFAGGRFIKSFQIPSTAILYNRIRWSRDGRSILYKDIMQGLWEQKITVETPQQPPGLDDIRVIHLGAAGDKLIVSGGKKMRENHHPRKLPLTSLLTEISEFLIEKVPKLGWSGGSAALDGFVSCESFGGFALVGAARDKHRPGGGTTIAIFSGNADSPGRGSPAPD
jgi:hypothetical protein